MRGRLVAVVDFLSSMLVTATLTAALLWALVTW